MITVTRNKSEAGFTLAELMVIASLFTILGLSFVSSNAMFSNSRGRILHNSLASQLAIEGVEQFAGIDPVTLTAANSSSASVVRSNITFTRAITITVNSDGSRTIAVSVNCSSVKLGGTASLTTNLPKWGSA